MSDRFFAEIKDPRERAVTEALWNSQEIWHCTTPERIAAHKSSSAARAAVQPMQREARSFLAMYDAAQRFPLPAEERHR